MFQYRLESGAIIRKQIAYLGYHDNEALVQLINNSRADVYPGNVIYMIVEQKGML